MSKLREIIGVTFGAAVILAGITYIVNNIVIKPEKRSKLGKKVYDHVEMVDGEPGISFTDRLDFIERTDVPEGIVKKMKQPGYTFERDLLGPGGFSSETLETALESYKGEKNHKDY